MKLQLIPTLALGLLVSSVTAQDKPDLTNPKQRTSYAIGMDIGSTFRQQGMEIDLKALAAGIADATEGKPALTEKEQREVMMKFQQEMTAKQQALEAKQEAEDKVLAVKNLKDGEAFLAENAKKPGVKLKQVTAPDGTKAELQYLVIKSGP